MQQQSSPAESMPSAQLFMSFSDHMREVFLQLSRTAELAPTLDEPTQREYWQMTREIADAALQIAQAYTLQARLQSSSQPEAVEPFAVSSLLHDAAQALEPFAKRYSVQLQLDTSAHSLPVVGNRELLAAALVSLGQVFVVAEAQSDDTAFIRLAAHQSRYGVVAGVYGEQHEINAGALRRARALAGKTPQPFAKLAAGPAAGVFIAESLLESMAAKLHVARYHNLTGLATTLPSCNQLQLV